MRRLINKKIRLGNDLLKNNEQNNQDVLLGDSLAELKCSLAQQEITRIVIPQFSNELFKDNQAKILSAGFPTIVLSPDNEENSYNIPEQSLSLLFKRLIDIVVSCLGLFLVGAVYILIYPVVQKQSPGPVFFAQTRVGKHGKRFSMYKFRSMALDAEERKADLLQHNDVSSDLMFKMEKDPRVFPLGQRLRDWSVDELPQLINVLRGDMSLVGTRPPTVEEYEKYDWHHFKRLAMKPGITGMWQVSGRSNIQNFEQVVKLDTAYIDNWSLWLDVKILLKTIKVVLLKEGSR